MSGVLPKEERLKRRAEVGRLYEENWTVAQIAEELDISRQQVYDDLNLLEDAGQISRKSAKDSAMARFRARVKQATIKKGMSDIELAIVNDLTVREAINMRKFLHIPVTTPVSITSRREKLVELMFGNGYKPSDRFVEYFSQAFENDQVLYDYYVRCCASEVDKRHKRGYARRTFVSKHTADQLVKKEVLCQVKQ